MKSCVRESLSNWRFSNRIFKIIENSNKLLEQDLSDHKIYSEFYKQFRLILLFSSRKLRNISSEKDFEEFARWLQQIFHKLNIEKIYNISTVEFIDEFDELWLFEQFFYISVPRYWNEHFKFIKWWACHHRSLFFYNMFDQIDAESKLNKELWLVSWKHNHSMLKVWFQWSSYIIDPYSKKNWLINKVTKWNSIYLWMNSKKLYFAEFKNENWDLLDDSISLSKFENKATFLSSIEKEDKFLINFKTFLEWKEIALLVRNWDHLLVNFRVWDWPDYKTWKRKEIVQVDLLNLMLNNWDISSFDILKEIIWIEEGVWVDKEIIDAIELVSKHIDKDSIFRDLWIPDPKDLSWKTTRK